MGVHVCKTCTRWLRQVLDHANKISNDEDQRNKVHKFSRHEVESASLQQDCCLCEKLLQPWLHLELSDDDSTRDRLADDLAANVYCTVIYIPPPRVISTLLIEPTPPQPDGQVTQSVDFRCGETVLISFRGNIALSPSYDVLDIDGISSTTVAFESFDLESESHTGDDGADGHTYSHESMPASAQQMMHDKRLDLICSWLRNCQSFDHGTCEIERSYDTETKYLPKRLVMVGNSNDEMKVFEPFDEDYLEDIKYATLSHCWGRTPFLTLTTENQIDLARHLPFERLTRTFQDAVQLCRALRIRYIWIDSLCIIQTGDGQRDWLEQAAQMERVYGGSILNLAASDSGEGDEGLFRPYEYSFGRRLAMRFPDGHLVEKPGPASSMCQQRFESSPLHSRGWVFQELFLAPRTLHFTSHEMVWSCKSGAFSESYPLRAVKRGTESDSIGAFSALRYILPFTISALLNEERLDQHWLNVIEAYSDMQLTFESDVLFALSGVAYKFEEAYKRCLAATENKSFDFAKFEYSNGLEIVGGSRFRPETISRPSETWDPLRDLVKDPHEYADDIFSRINEAWQNQPDLVVNDGREHLKWASSQYVFGCWRHSLVRWLLWRRHDNSPAPELDASLRTGLVPSWSWLSLPRRNLVGQSVLDAERYESLAKVSLEDGEEISPISLSRDLEHRGALTLQGPSFSFRRVESTRSKPSPALFCLHETGESFTSDVESGSVAQTLNFTFDRGSRVDNTAIGQTLDCVCLLAANDSSRFRGPDYIGMVLKEGETEGIHRRIGYFELTTKGLWNYRIKNETHENKVSRMHMWSVVDAGLRSGKTGVKYTVI